MKEKLKKVFCGIIIAIIIVLAILWYPWFVEVKNGETICRNLLGFKMDCD